MLQRLLLTASLLSSIYGAGIMSSQVTDEDTKTMVSCYGIPINQVHWPNINTSDRSITQESAKVVRVTKQLSIFGQLPNLIDPLPHQEFTHEETIFGQFLPLEKKNSDSEIASLPIMILFKFTSFKSTSGLSSTSKAAYTLTISSNHGNVTIYPNASNTIRFDCSLTSFSFEESDDTNYSFAAPIFVSISPSPNHRPITFSLLISFTPTDGVFQITDSFVTNECSINFEETLRRLPLSTSRSAP